MLGILIAQCLLLAVFAVDQRELATYAYTSSYDPYTPTVNGETEEDSCAIENTFADGADCSFSF